MSLLSWKKSLRASANPSASTRPTFILKTRGTLPDSIRDAKHTRKNEESESLRLDLLDRAIEEIYTRHQWN